MKTPSDLSLASLRAAYLQNRFTPRELLESLQRRARALDDEFHLYISLLDNDQLEPYLAALDGKAPASLPLYGIPFAIKDNIDLAGVPTTAACPDYAYTPERSAAVLQRLIDLGAIPTGKTNLDQFATGLNGLRSPYGECRNSALPDYPSGGSSSGSALAVSLGVASFALGTDTAGSGRVPAALNGLIGCKPSRGLLSLDGVVPCCRSLDCLSLFTANARDSAELLALATSFDEHDSESRRNPAWNAAPAVGAPRAFRFGVPRRQDRVWLGCEESPALFDAACAAMEALGGRAVEVDFSPFLQAARMLYEPAGAAERYAAFGGFIERKPQAVLSVIREIVAVGAHASAVDRVLASHHLRALKQSADRAMESVDVMLSPTLPRAFTRAQIHAEPILRNSELGTYTNFMNLLDYAAVAVPAGRMRNDLPWGVTLFGRVFNDQYLLALAQALQDRAAQAADGVAASGTLGPGDRLRIVVCGAHLAGLPLNHQLLGRGARLIEATRTASGYRLHALPGGPPYRPALVRDASGRAIEVEVWELPSAEIGSFLAGIGAPLGLGKLQLADGRWESGFICEHGVLESAIDITEFGGWRAYLASTRR